MKMRMRSTIAMFAVLFTGSMAHAQYCTNTTTMYRSYGSVGVPGPAPVSYNYGYSYALPEIDPALAEPLIPTPPTIVYLATPTAPTYYGGGYYGGGYYGGGYYSGDPFLRNGYYGGGYYGGRVGDPSFRSGYYSTTYNRGFVGGGYNRGFVGGGNNINVAVGRGGLFGRAPTAFVNGFGGGGNNINVAVGGRGGRRR